MKHKESDLQIRCIKWFRYQYPAYARLMEHPHNEGNGFNRRQQAIANAEGVTKGVADLILHVPSFSSSKTDKELTVNIYHSLAIEMKDVNGKQSPEQKTWQRLFEAAGGLYLIIRDYDSFVEEVTRWMLSVPQYIDKAVKDTHAEIMAEEDRKAIELLKEITSKK